MVSSHVRWVQPSPRTGSALRAFPIVLPKLHWSRRSATLVFMRAVSVFMDVEDPINPLADPACLDIAHLFTNLSVRGSFCITGEKCRSLMSRHRGDVLEAFKPHCLGLHTNTHSQHPTTMELLADVDYEEGRELAFKSQKPGYDSFLEAFDRPPCFWGGAGNTWSPEINDALRRLAIPAYTYSLTRVPEDRVHQFNGVIGLPQNIAIGETQWADDLLAEQQMQAVLEFVESSNSPLLGIFVGHPTRFRHTQYWDLGYNNGVTADPYPMTPPVDEPTYQRSLNNLRTFLMRLRRIADIVGVDDMLKFDWSFRPPTEVERDYFRVESAKYLAGAAHWPIHRPDLNPDNIISKTLSLESTLFIAELD